MVRALIHLFKRFIVLVVCYHVHKLLGFCQQLRVIMLIFMLTCAFETVNQF